MKQAISPKDAFDAESKGADRMVREINTALEDGKRTISVSGEFPADFRKRVVVMYESHGWSVTDNNGTLTFVEKVPVVKTEKEALQATQLITNLILFINECIQTGKREIDSNLIEQNLERISSGLEKKIEKVDDIAKFFTEEKSSRQFERLLELAGWKLESFDEGMKLSAL